MFRKCIVLVLVVKIKALLNPSCDRRYSGFTVFSIFSQYNTGTRLTAERSHFLPCLNYRPRSGLCNFYSPKSPHLADLINYKETVDLKATASPRKAVDLRRPQSLAVGFSPIKLPVAPILQSPVKASPRKVVEQVGGFFWGKRSRFAEDSRNYQ